jgi:hypothetical protein
LLIKKPCLIHRSLCQFMIFFAALLKPNLSTFAVAVGLKRLSTIGAAHPVKVGRV